jgi:hypothetical protein
MPVKTCEGCGRPVVVRRHRYGTGTTVPACPDCSAPPPVVEAPVVEDPAAALVAGWTINEVLEWVADGVGDGGGDPAGRAAYALGAELARGEESVRRTLVAKLQRIIDQVQDAE